MRLWSKGLGKLILPFEIDKAESISEYDDGGRKVILIQGRIIEKKVNWPYKIYLDIDDMVRFTAFMAKNNIILSYIKSYCGYRFIISTLSLMLRTIFLYLPVVIFEKVVSFFKGIFAFRKGVSQVKPSAQEQKVMNRKTESVEIGKTENVEEKGESDTVAIEQVQAGGKAQ